MRHHQHCTTVEHSWQTTIANNIQSCQLAQLTWSGLSTSHTAVHCPSRQQRWLVSQVKHPIELSALSRSATHLLSAFFALSQCFYQHSRLDS